MKRCKLLPKTDEVLQVIRSFCVNYCDDIRHELGNKISLIGIYGSDLLLPEVPAVIPKLCIYAQLYGEPDKTFDDKMELKVTLDDAVIATSISTPSTSSLKPRQFQKIGAQIVISPFFIEEECTLRVSAYYKDQEYKSSALKIRSQSSSGETKESE